MSAILRRSGRPLRLVGLMLGPLSSEQPQVGDDEWNDEVARGLDPRDCGCITADDYVGLVDHRKDHADDERDPDRTAQVLSTQADPRRLRDSHAYARADGHLLLLASNDSTSILFQIRSVVQRV